MKAKFWSRIDWPMTGVILALLAFGVVNIHSASYRPHEDDYAAFAAKQVFWIGIGLSVYVFTVFLNYRKLGRLAYPLYFASLLALAVTLLFPPIRGARSWIPLGFMNVQTSEAAKIFIILALARFLADRPPERLTDYVGPALLLSVPLALLLAQPDLGTAVLFGPVCLVMLFVRGAKTKHLAILVVLAAQAIPLSYPFLKEHQKARLRSFVSITNMTEGQALGESYQGHQSRIAVGAGGVLGRGWGEGTQNRGGFIPDRHDDFIFSVICEEWGFLGATLVLGLHFLLAFLCLAGADQNRDVFGRMFAVGIVTLNGCQVLVNTGMTIGLVPITGLTLPLVSYGGSSLVTTLFGLGLVMNVKMRPASA